MILADKIITLRKKAGWSQEELASQLGVTRQSVSKWEGAQSVPDLDKVVQMSRLFGVSTDYLLKDELEEEEFVESEADEAPLRRVTMEQAARYLALRKACAPKIALAVAMCIVSPVVIIFLSAMADAGLGGISENLAAGVGVSVILVLVAIAVGMFLSCGAKTKEFDFLEKEPFETEYGVSGMVRERRKAYEPTASRCTILGVVLCILAVVPLMLGVGLASSDVAALLVRETGKKVLLLDGDRLKVTVRFRGREMAHTNIGEQLLTNFAAQCAEIATMDKNPKMEGRNMFMFLSPKAPDKQANKK